MCFVCQANASERRHSSDQPIGTSATTQLSTSLVDSLHLLDRLLFIEPVEELRILAVWNLLSRSAAYEGSVKSEFTVQHQVD